MRFSLNFYSIVNVMKLELKSAVNFLVHILRLARCNIKETTLQKFKENLILEMYRSYRFHWYPENPVKGSGYRIIRINAYKVDPILVQAAKKVRIPLSILTNNMPHLILWIILSLFILIKNIGSFFHPI